MRRTLGFLLLMPTLLVADEVHIKGGAVFTGRIVDQTDTMVTIDIGDGQIGLPMTRVDSIVKKRSPLDDYDERSAALKANDANGWRDLGRWASHQGLSVQSRQAYQKVLDVVPDDPEARGALGFVLYNDRWMTEDESYQARGYVKVDGEWMTPNQAQVAASDAASEQARYDAEQRAKQAETDKLLAEARADEAEQRARDAEQKQDFWNKQPPVYWGGWGVGATGWPSTANVHWRSGYRPATSVPVRGGVR